MDEISLDERKDARMEVRLSRAMKAAIERDAAERGVSATFLLIGCYQLWARSRPERRQGAPEPQKPQGAPPVVEVDDLSTSLRALQSAIEGLKRVGL